MNLKPSARTSRREIMKICGLSTAGIWLPGCANALISRRISPDIKSQGLVGSAKFAAMSPINRNVKPGVPPFEAGYDYSRMHGVHYGKFKEYISQLPSKLNSIYECHDVVIVGGGISGLTSAWLLREFQPILLEGQTRLGGPSQGESWDGFEYPIGTAYFSWPEKNSELGKFYRTLGIDKKATIRAQNDPVVLNDKLLKNFWIGVTDPKHPEQFVAIHKLFKDTLKNRNGYIYPDLPNRDPQFLEQITDLDSTTFYDYLLDFLKEKKLGTNLHPHIMVALEHYSWSALGASITQVSAAAALNFYCAEFGEIAVLPGGNGAIAEHLFRQLSQPESGRPADIRSGCVVFDVRTKDQFTFVSFESADGKLQTLKAKTTIMATPKFVAKHIVENYPPTDLEEFLGETGYTSYVVGSVLIDKKLPDDLYDLFLLGKINKDDPKFQSPKLIKEGALPLPPFLSNYQNEGQVAGFTDVIFGSYTQHQANRGVISLFQALPEETSGDNTWGELTAGLMSPERRARYAQEFKEQFLKEIAPLINLPASSILDIRMAFWGHAMAAAYPGILENQNFEKLSRPHRERIFFVHHDNWQLPSIETALSEAFHWAPKVKEKILST